MATFRTNYEPDHLEWLAHVFDEARRRYAETTGRCDAVAEDVIAHNIVGLAWRGEKDFERLVAHSLRDVTAAARRVDRPLAAQRPPFVQRSSHWG
jgi:hypothetical protein